MSADAALRKSTSSIALHGFEEKDDDEHEDEAVRDPTLSVTYELNASPGYKIPIPL